MPTKGHYRTLYEPGWSRGLLQFTVIPFGLYSASATFQRLINLITNPDIDSYCFAYLDFNRQNLRKTFGQTPSSLKRLWLANLKLNPGNFQFSRKSLKYFVPLVRAKDICTYPDKVDSMQAMPEPNNIRRLRIFLGVASCYRRFVPDFTNITAPLSRLLKNNSTWVWNDEQQEIFQKLRDSLTPAAVLVCFDCTRTANWRVGYGLRDCANPESSWCGLCRTLC